MRTYRPLYLTGGTALGRFFLNHRYSDDIDFFANSDQLFKKTVSKIRLILEQNFETNPDKLILYDDFIRVWVMNSESELKVEFVNDVPYRWGKSIVSSTKKINIDNPGNILSNKIGAVVGRDEPKDVFDVIHLSLNYSFNWAEIFEHTIRKSVVAEQDVAMRLNTFPVDLFATQPWLKNSLDIDQMREKLETISDDFLFARDNSLGKDKTPITKAKIIQ
ncbi:MAG: nucleotidyl transferase AbiEii/AbiGii toxin family protein [Chitinophagales bacterium]